MSLNGACSYLFITGFDTFSDGSLSMSTKTHKYASNHRLMRSAIYWSALVFLPIQSFDALAQETIVIDINVVGLNINQEGAATQLGDACTTLGSNVNNPDATLQTICDVLADLDPNIPADVARLQELTSAVAPEEAFAVNDSLVVFSDYQTTNVRARLNALRQPNVNIQANWQNGLAPVAPGKNDPAHPEPTGGSASGDFLSRAGGFVNGSVSNGSIDGNRLQQNASIASSSLTLGGDYRFGDHVIGGFGLGVLQDESSFKQVSGGAQSDGFNVTAFASWSESDQGYLDVVLDLGQTQHDLKRSIAISPDTLLTAISSPSSTATSITVSAGRNFKPAGWDLGAYFRLSHTSASIGAYSESFQSPQPGLGTLFSVGKQTVLSSKMVVGLELTKIVNTSKAVLIPMFRIEYINENERKKDNIDATLIATETLASYVGEDRVTGYSNIGFGASAVLRGGKSVFAYYETHLQHDLISQNWLKVGARLEF
jgi:uncharacterized protein YhjY with autotransporter beta-barrel domain